VRSGNWPGVVLLLLGFGQAGLGEMKTDELEFVVRWDFTNQADFKAWSSDCNNVDDKIIVKKIKDGGMILRHELFM